MSKLLLKNKIIIHREACSGVHFPDSKLWFPAFATVFYFILFYSTFISASWAQELPRITGYGEELHNLGVNPALFRKYKKPPASYLKNISKWIYYTDTLSLPFVDDFSINRIKNFNVDTGDTNITLISKVLFEVNGNFQDSAEIMNDTTWFFQFNSLTLQYDTFPNPPLIITFYRNNNPDSVSDLTLPTSIDTFWSNITYKFNASDTDTIILARDTVFLNSRDSFFLVNDNPFYLWIDSTAHINNGFAVNPPTIGVATFDGLNALGEAYNFSAPLVQGPADRLTSKPIDLSNLTSDSNVVFSFYYQPQGMGDFPDTEDSLVLEFYSPQDSAWNWIWSTPGITTTQAYQQPVFNYVKIAVTDPKFLAKGFKCRFRNYATLSGMLDIWNVDYVYLDKNRDISDNSINDFGFVSIGNSFISSYTSMPMNAFKAYADLYMTQSFPVKMANLGNNTLSADSNRYIVYDETETLIHKESSLIQSSFAPFSQQTINHSVYAAPNNYYFLPSASPRTVFKIKFLSGQSSQDIIPYNDNLIFPQVFDSYFAYDDGSAEGIYSLGNKPGVRLACKFNTALPDSLKGLYLYFPYMLNDVSSFTFEILVWDDNNGVPGNIVYQSTATANPDYSTTINEFVRYKIDPPIVIGGTFYVGWKQSTGDKIYLGFDKNTNTQSKIFHTLAQNNSWANTGFTGSLMMRPDFGNDEPIKRLDSSSPKIAAIHVYPNPANDHIYFGNLADKEMASYEVKLFNILGREIFRKTLYDVESSIDISSIQNGIYFLKIEGFSMEKVIISR